VQNGFNEWGTKELIVGGSNNIVHMAKIVVTEAMQSRGRREGRTIVSPAYSNKSDRTREVGKPVFCTLKEALVGKPSTDRALVEDGRSHKPI